MTRCASLTNLASFFCLTSANLIRGVHCVKLALFVRFSLSIEIKISSCPESAHWPPTSAPPSARSKVYPVSATKSHLGGDIHGATREPLGRIFIRIASQKSECFRDETKKETKGVQKRAQCAQDAPIKQSGSFSLALLL